VGGLNGELAIGKRKRYPRSTLPMRLDPGEYDLLARSRPLDPAAGLAGAIQRLDQLEQAFDCPTLDRRRRQRNTAHASPRLPCPPDPCFPPVVQDTRRPLVAPYLVLITGPGGKIAVHAILEPYVPHQDTGICHQASALPVRLAGGNRRLGELRL